MTIPEKFRKSGEPALANYDFIDIAEGTGIVNYFGYAHGESAGGVLAISYGLSTDTLQTERASQGVAEERDGATMGEATHTDMRSKIDMDFDLKFNLPKRIKGKIKVECSYGGVTATGGGNGANIFPKLLVRKWDGTTETEITEAEGRIFAIPIDVDTNTRTIFEADVSTIQHFKKGETLRLTMQLWAQKITNNRIIIFYHNPKNTRTDKLYPLSHSQVFKAQVPYLIDI